MHKSTTLLALFLLTLGLILQSGCAQQCAQIKQDYSQALAQESSLIESPSFKQGMPTHVGIGLRYKVLADLAERLLGKSLSQGLDITTAIPVGGGKSIKVALQSRTVGLGFAPDKSCETCFRVVGDLGGKADLDIPLLGKRTVPLDGSLNLIAPIIMESLEDNSVKVKLDLKKLSDYAGTFLQLELKDLPEATSRLVKQPLTREIFKRMTANLEPLELFSFKAPDLKVPGIRMFPSEFKLVPEKKAIFVGFTTNLPGIASGEGLTAAQALAFEEGENAAVSVQPSILLPAVTALIQEGTIPRRYTLQGAADPNGPTHIIMKRIAVGAQAIAAQATQAAAPGNEPLELGFRAWNMMGGPCFWFDAVIKGLVTLQNGKLQVALEAVELTDASTAPELIKALSNWKSSEFAERTGKLIERSLTAPRIEIPGGALTLAPNSLAKDARTLTLRSKVSFELGGASN